ARQTSARIRPRPSITWSALHNKPLISLLSGNPVQQLIESHLKEIGRAHEERPAYANLQTVLGMVEAGMGGAILPALVAPACDRNRIVMRTLTDPSVGLDFYQITKKGRPPPHGGKALAAAVMEMLSATSLG